MNLRKMNVTVVSETTEETLCLDLQPVDLEEGVTDVCVKVTDTFLKQLPAKLEEGANVLLNQNLEKIKELAGQSNMHDETAKFLESFFADLSYPIPKEFEGELREALTQLVSFCVGVNGSDTDMIKGSITKSGNDFVINLYVWDEQIPLLNTKIEPVYIKKTEEEKPVCLSAIVSNVKDKISQQPSVSFADILSKFKAKEIPAKVSKGFKDSKGLKTDFKEILKRFAS